MKFNSKSGQTTEGPCAGLLPREDLAPIKCNGKRWDDVPHGIRSLSEQNLNAITGGGRDFRTTHWSLVWKACRADDADAAGALDKLCRAYWYPLYAFVRRRGYDPETARDLTQSFFAALLARNGFAVADPARGRFRSFLVHSLTHFLANEWRDSQRLKRGGGAFVFSLDGLEPEERYRLEPSTGSDAEKLFERRWAYTLVEGALEQLRAEHERAGKGRMFGELAAFLPGGEPIRTMADTAQSLGMSESAVKVAVHRLRQRFRALFREEVARTVDKAEEVDNEVRYVVEALSL